MLNLEKLRFITCLLCDGELLPLNVGNIILPDKRSAVCGFCMWRFENWRQHQWHNENRSWGAQHKTYDYTMSEYDDQMPDDIRMAKFLAIELRNIAKGKMTKLSKRIGIVDGEYVFKGQIRKKRPVRNKT